MNIRTWLRSPHGGLLWLGLLLVGVVLLVTSIPGVFSVDENHYLAALRALETGSQTVPDFNGLDYSPELAAFDPCCRYRPAGCVTTTVPPLYALLAFPFYQLGWPGLVLVNVLCFLACAAMVFFYTRRYAQGPAAPWLGLFAFLLAGYSIEYAQGVWPHMLAVALCTAAMLLASRVRGGGPLYLLLVAGLLAGLATGVRYQNIVFAGAIGLGVAIWCRRRFLSGGLYLAGVAGPLFASSLMNYFRHGNWNPISKGPYYLSVGAGDTVSNPALEALSVFWTRVVDFSFHPPLGQTLHQLERMLHPDPDSGAYLLLGKALKKAWLQSSPWIMLALLALMLAWKLPWRANFENRQPNTKSRELRSMFIIFGCVLGAFSLAGFKRVDGMCFNQRYFLELLPLAAVALAWFLDGRRLGARVLLAGGLLGVLLAAGPLIAWDPKDGFRHLLLQKIPLVLAGMLLLAWIMARKQRWSSWLGVFLGACLSWAVVVHFCEDLTTSRFVRQWRAQQKEAVAKVLPDSKSAVFAYWGYKDGLGPLQIDHDLLIADPWIDEGRDSSRLTGELLASGRRVFVLAAEMPKRIFDQIAEGRRYRLLAEKPYPILEVAAHPDPEGKGGGR